MQATLKKIAKRVGSRISIARRARDLNQTQFAELMGVSTKTVSQWETGTIDIRISQLVKVGEVLKVNMDWFILPKAQISITDLMDGADEFEAPFVPISAPLDTTALLTPVTD